MEKSKHMTYEVFIDSCRSEKSDFTFLLFNIELKFIYENVNYTIKIFDGFSEKILSNLGIEDFELVKINNTYKLKDIWQELEII